MIISKQLSISIPTYGNGYFLDKCLKSIEDQTTPVECMVCGGESSFNFSDPRWNWVTCELLSPDPGMVSCWSNAANKSSGEYLAFLADDNALEPEFAEKMLTFMVAHPTCEVAFCNQYVIDEEGCLNKEDSYKMTEFYGRHKLNYGLLQANQIPHLIQYNSIPLEACIIRRSIWERYGPFATQAFGAFDLHFFTKLLSFGVQFGFLDEYLARFRQHPNSYTIRQREQHLKGAIWTLQDIESSNPKIQKLLQKKMLIYYESLLQLDLPEQERKKVEQQLIKHPLGLLTLAKSRIKRNIKHTVNK